MRGGRSSFSRWRNSTPLLDSRAGAGIRNGSPMPKACGGGPGKTARSERYKAGVPGNGSRIGGGGIGRASCRGRVEISVVAGSLKKKKRRRTKAPRGDVIVEIIGVGDDRGTNVDMR